MTSPGTNHQQTSRYHISNDIHVQLNILVSPVATPWVNQEPDFPNWWKKILKIAKVNRDSIFPKKIKFVVVTFRSWKFKKEGWKSVSTSDSTRDSPDIHPILTGQDVGEEESSHIHLRSHRHVKLQYRAPIHKLSCSLRVLIRFIFFRYTCTNNFVYIVQYTLQGNQMTE